MPAPTVPLVLKVSEVAEMLSMSKQQVYRLIYADVFGPHEGLPKTAGTAPQWRIPRDRVLAYAQSPDREAS